MFHLPKIPPQPPTRKRKRQDHEGIQSFDYSQVSSCSLIGAGGYGEVFLGKYNGKNVVLKVWHHAEEKEILHEARFLNYLKHDNLVEFKAMCLQEKALMLGYAEFNFMMFGKAKSVSSLDGLLRELDQSHFKNFEHIIPSISHQIIEGIRYLHNKGVAHRDLKPGNVLVSNQHLQDIADQKELERLWKDSPCRVMLTDFGESWGNICQTSQIAKTHTNSIYKGTPVFMAPEILDPARRPQSLSEAEMKMSDIWSLGMLFFCLINPDTLVPYVHEATQQEKKNWTRYITAKITNGVLPKDSMRYDHLRASWWYKINKFFLRCIRIDAFERPSLDEISEILLSELESNSLEFPFSLHQGTALVHAQEQNLIGGSLKLPKNDGTNACMFLSLKNAECLLKSPDQPWDDVKKNAEHIINFFPARINHLRNHEESYEIHDAYQLMRSNNSIAECLFHTRCQGSTVFSEDGKKQLEYLLGRSQGVFVVTVPPYAFVISKQLGQWIVIDTHVISESLGGNGNGILKVFNDEESIMHWIWMRLAKSAVISSILQVQEIVLANHEMDTSDVEVESVSTSCKGTKTDTGQQFILSSDSEVSQNAFSEGKEVESNDLEDNIDERSDNPPLIDLTESPESITNRIQVKRVLSGKTPLTKDALYAPISWDRISQEQWGPYRMPYFQCLNRKLKNEEALALIMSNCTKTRRIPQACRRNAIFVIDAAEVKDPNDVKSDLNGVFRICHEVKCLTVHVDVRSKEENVRFRVEDRKKVELQENFMYLMIHRRENDFGLVRNIMYFMGPDNNIVNESILLQYYINRKVCGNTDVISFDVLPHGNFKRDKQQGQFYPLKKSTLDSIRKAISPRKKANRSRVYDDITKGINDESDYGDAPRSKKQISDVSNSRFIKERRKPTNEVDALLAYNEELGEDSMILHHSDIPSDLWVLSTKRMLSDLRRAEGGLPLSVDPTFNFGKFEVTPLAYRHRFLESKSRNVSDSWHSAVMIGPTIIQHDKSEETYDKAIREIARHTSLSTCSIGIATDGEQALIKACERNCKGAIMLRCTRHIQVNCKEFLSTIGVKGSDAEPMLEVVFGKNGLIEAKDKKDLKVRLKDAKVILAQMEAEILQVDSGSVYESKFYKYLKEREKLVLRRVIQNARSNAGMPNDANGNPERIYTNQSESVNSILAARKAALGFSRKDDLSKTQFVRDVWESVVKYQDSEICKALTGSSSNYRLSEEARYLSVRVEDWYQWTTQQKNSYVSAFNKLSSEDVRNKKEISLPEISFDFIRTPIQSLSVKLSTALPSLMYADVIEKKAVELLNSRNAIVLAPVINEIIREKKYLVAGSNPSPYNVRAALNGKGKICCNCKGFKFAKICKHSVAVAEKEGTLENLIANVKIAKRSAITYPNMERGAGRKGGQPRRLRVYQPSTPSGSSTESSPFTKIWHNNEPFTICNVHEISKERNRCGHCSREFPRGVLAVIPFDIALQHKERWQYPNRSKASNEEPDFLPSPANRMTTKHYCISRSCIFQRFPYFRQELIQVPPTFGLKESHKKLLSEQLDAVL